MASAYSQDLRKRALYFIKTGMSITDVSRLLDISRPTLYKWKRMSQTTGNSLPKTKVPSTHQAKITDWNKFKVFVELHGDKTLSEMAALWGNCTRHTISRGLKKINYTRKKKLILIKNAVQ